MVSVWNMFLMFYYVLSFSTDVVYTLSYVHHTVVDLLHACKFFKANWKIPVFSIQPFEQILILKNHCHSVFSILSYVNKSFLQFDFIMCY